MQSAHIVISKIDEDDYTVWFTDDLEDKNSGYSERDTLENVMGLVQDYLD